MAFGDTDPAGLVYYPNLLHYCHIAMERFFAERCEIKYSDLITPTNTNQRRVLTQSLQPKVLVFKRPGVGVWGSLTTTFEIVIPEATVESGG